jgi:three-Cys-motif partner protein
MPDERRSKRTWGFWTRAKLGVLDDYLRAFVRAAGGVAERIYLDAFAGEGMGTDRFTGEEFRGSARIALAVDDPPFTRLRFFERPARAEELRLRLAAEFSGRDIKVYGGDCNTTIPQALAGLRHLRWAPTFAFIDPDGMELAWETLLALADHKRGYRTARSAKREYKVEMWMLFPSSGLMRALELNRDPTDEDARKATRLFGDETWSRIHDLRRRGEIDGREAREEYVNLMRWRLERVLGYRWTHPLEVKNLRGGPLYHMILATDNDAGTRIMSDLYRRAAETIPQMRQEIRERLRHPDQPRLLDPGAPEIPKGSYAYQPPWLPA